MEDEKQRQAYEKKELEKAMLATGLYELLLRLPHLVNEGHTQDAVINGVLLATPNVLSPSLKILPQLHKAGFLGQYIRELQSEDKLNDSRFQSIIDQILEITPAQPPEPPKVPVRSTSPNTSSAEPLSVDRHQKGVSHKLGCSGIFSPKTRENLKTAGTIAGLSIGPAIFLGTGIAGLVLSAKAAAAVTAVAAFAATAGAVFPPFAIGLLVVAGVALIVGAIILTAWALSAKNSSAVDATLAASARNVW